MRYAFSMGQSERDPLFFPPAKYGAQDDPEHMPPEVDTESQEKRLRVVVLLGSVVVVVALFAIQSGPVREAWNHLLGRPAGALTDAELGKVMHEPPQRQAVRLLSAALHGDSRAAAYAETNAQSWRGSLMLDPTLNALVLNALAANDLRVRSAAIEVYLAGYSLSENEVGVDRVLRIASGDPQHRQWALYTLGMMGHRGLNVPAVRAALLGSLHDPDEWTRVGAVDGLAMLGTEDAVAPLLEVLHNDPSSRVREHAAAAVSHSGMMSAEVRRTALPGLLEYAADSSLDAATRRLVFAALRDISGQDLPDDPSRWKAWYSAQTVGTR